MFKAIFLGEEAGSFSTFYEAFSALYEKLIRSQKKGVFSPPKEIIASLTFIEYNNIKMPWYNIGDVGRALGMLREGKNNELCEPRVMLPIETFREIFLMVNEGGRESIEPQLQELVAKITK